MATVQATREGVWDWTATASAASQKDLLQWLSLADRPNKKARGELLLNVFDAAPNLVRCALDCLAFVGDAADAPGFSLMERFGNDVAGRDADDNVILLKEFPTDFVDLVAETDASLPEGIRYAWGVADSSRRRRGSPPSGADGSRPPSGVSSGRGRNGSLLADGRTGDRDSSGGRSGRSGHEDGDDDRPVSSAQVAALLARLKVLEDRPSPPASGGDTYTQSQVDKLVKDSVDAALHDINTGKRALVLAATAKQRRRVAEWELRPTCQVFDAELPPAGDSPINVLASTSRNDMRRLLFASTVHQDRVKRLLQRYPASSSWSPPPEIPVESTLAYEQMGVTKADAAAASTQSRLLDDLRPVVFCLQRLGDLRKLVADFTGAPADASASWDLEDRQTLDSIASASRDATQAASDVLHVLASQLSEKQRERDRLALVAESGVRDAKLQFDPATFEPLPISADSPERWSTVRADIVKRAGDVRTRNKQLGIAFDAAAKKPPNFNGGKQGGGGGGQLSKADRERRANKNKKRAEKRRAAASKKRDEGGAVPEPQSYKDKVKGKGSQ